MPLSIQRPEEINAELQQMRERLLALAEELAAAAVPGNNYESIYQAAKFAAGRVEYVLRLMTVAEQREQTDSVMF